MKEKTWQDVTLIVGLIMVGATILLVFGGILLGLYFIILSAGSFAIVAYQCFIMYKHSKWCQKKFEEG